VLGVEGIGTGFGLSLGNRLLQEITRPAETPPAPLHPPARADRE
jgi:hypothetical protein